MNLPPLLPDSHAEAGSRDPMSLSLALVVLILNYLDAHFTSWIIAGNEILHYSHPVGAELNPVWEYVLQSFGINWFVVLKMMFVLTFVWIVLVAKKSFSRGALLFIAGYYVNMIIVQYAHAFLKE